ncbi:hypothetical protein [Phytopseudomonas dryadis]|uniref:hypothetical protein n=1 Tax=Pseudomonadaceae TaxID=135621 RepID=UPI0013F15493|nr:MULTISPECIES: hypothetical protein [Pseudomonas]
MASMCAPLDARTLNLNNVLDKKHYASLTGNGVYGAPRSALLSPCRCSSDERSAPSK